MKIKERNIIIASDRFSGVDDTFIALIHIGAKDTIIKMQNINIRYPVKFIGLLKRETSIRPYVIRVVTMNERSYDISFRGIFDNGVDTEFIFFGKSWMTVR